jgi:uncharacterized membrane protein
MEYAGLDYPTLKWIHILSAIFLFGTGVGTAFFKFMADRAGNLHNIAYTNRHVVLADWLFTTPAVIIQPVSGFMLMFMLGYSLVNLWLLISTILYVFVIACWLPVVVMQLRMSRLSRFAVKQGEPLSSEYHRLRRLWVSLGLLAFIGMMAITYLMIFKPVIRL